MLAERYDAIVWKKSCKFYWLYILYSLSKCYFKIPICFHSKTGMSLEHMPLTRRSFLKLLSRPQSSTSALGQWQMLVSDLSPLFLGPKSGASATIQVAFDTTFLPAIRTPLLSFAAGLNGSSTILRTSADTRACQISHTFQARRSYRASLDLRRKTRPGMHKERKRHGMD